MARPGGTATFDPNVGTNFVAHGHGAVGICGEATLGLHVIHAFVQDDRATPVDHTDWNSQDQVVLQYSRYLNGSSATTVWGAPPVRDPDYRLDENVVSSTASMWWWRAGTGRPAATVRSCARCLPTDQ